MGLKNTGQTLREYLTDHSDDTFETPGEEVWLGKTLLAAIKKDDAYTVPWHQTLSGYAIEKEDLDSDIYADELYAPPKRYIFPTCPGPMVQLHLTRK